MNKSSNRSIRHRLPIVSPEMREHSKALHKSMTKAETALWAGLRATDGIGKFHRQRVIGRYIVDFASLEVGLIIEVDGSQHWEPDNLRRDAERDEFLRSLGFAVLRFNDAEVLTNLSGVIDRVIEVVGNRKKPIGKEAIPLTPLQ